MFFGLALWSLLENDVCLRGMVACILLLLSGMFVRSGLCIMLFKTCFLVDLLSRCLFIFNSGALKSPAVIVSVEHPGWARLRSTVFGVIVLGQRFCPVSAARLEEEHPDLLAVLVWNRAAVRRWGR